ncbi:MAG: hypothetical protein Q7T92_13250 [Lutibacter sp.]|nr:hypothetical protein [Lutibacter sp.]
MFGKLFKPSSHFVYNYKPRYYDERKERLRNLENKYHNQNENDTEIPKISLSKNNLRNDWVKNKRSATNRSTNLRLALIIAILVAIVAYIFDLHTLF